MDQERGLLMKMLEPFQQADERDWEHLDRLLGGGGHGQFWRAVFREFRIHLQRAEIEVRK